MSRRLRRSLWPRGRLSGCPVRDPLTDIPARCLLVKDPVLLFLRPVRRREDCSWRGGRTAGPLFTTATGSRMGRPEAWKMIRRLVARAGLDGAAGIWPHSLRVAFIIGAREADVPLEDVRDAAGHTHPRTTRRCDRGRYSLDRHASYAVTSCAGGADGGLRTTRFPCPFERIAHSHEYSYRSSQEPGRSESSRCCVGAGSG